MGFNRQGVAARRRWEPRGEEQHASEVGTTGKEEIARTTGAVKMPSVEAGMPNGILSGAIYKCCWMLILGEFLYFYLSNSFYIDSWRCSN